MFKLLVLSLRVISESTNNINRLGMISCDAFFAGALNSGVRFIKSFIYIPMSTDRSNMLRSVLAALLIIANANALFGNYITDLTKISFVNFHQKALLNARI